MHSDAERVLDHVNSAVIGLAPALASGVMAVWQDPSPRMASMAEVAGNRVPIGDGSGSFEVAEREDADWDGDA